MFKLVDERIAAATYNIQMVDEEGRQRTFPVRMKVALIDQPSLSEWVKRLLGGEDGANYSEFMCHVLRGWDGVGDADGKQAEFSTANAEQFARAPGVSTAKFLQWYMKLWQGQVEEEEKNSGASPGDGSKGGAAEAETSQPN